MMACHIICMHFHLLTVSFFKDFRGKLWNPCTSVIKSLKFFFVQKWSVQWILLLITRYLNYLVAWDKEMNSKMLTVQVDQGRWNCPFDPLRKIYCDCFSWPVHFEVWSTVYCCFFHQCMQKSSWELLFLHPLSDKLNLYFISFSPIS